MGYSDTADMLKGVSATFHRQVEYYNIEVNDVKDKEEDYLQKCIVLLFGNYLVIEHKQYFRLKHMGERYPSPFSHLTDVDDLVDAFSTNNYTSKSQLKLNCKNSSCMVSFFEKYQNMIFYPCADHRIFAHCQQHWIAVYDSDKNIIHSYQKTPCF